MDAIIVVLLTSIVLLILGITIYVVSDHFRRLQERAIKAEHELEIIRASHAAVTSAIKSVDYTQNLMEMLDWLIQRAVALRMYRQLGKLPLEKLTAEMTVKIADEIAKSVYTAIDVDEITAVGIVTADYVNTYIVSATLTALDSTITKLVDG